MFTMQLLLCDTLEYANETGNSSKKNSQEYTNLLNARWYPRLNHETEKGQ